MFWSKTVIIFIDKIHRLLFLKTFENEDFHRIYTNRGINQIIFFNDSDSIFATIDEIGEVFWGLI